MSMLGKSALSLTDVYNADFKMLGEVDSEGTSDFRCLVPIFLLDTVFFPEVFVSQRDFLASLARFFWEIYCIRPPLSLVFGTSPLILNDELHFQAVGRHHPVHGGLCLLCLCLLCEWLEPKEFRYTHQSASDSSNVHVSRRGSLGHLNMRLGLVYISHKKPGTTLFGC